MGADPLSDVLHAVRLQGAVFFHVEARAPWVAESPRASRIAERIMPGVQHVIEWPAVIRGSCFGGLVGERQHRLEAGDVIVFPQGDAHTMSSAPGLRAEPKLDVYHRPTDEQLPFRLRHGEGGCDPRGPRSASHGDDAYHAYWGPAPHGAGEGVRMATT